jgi:O-antigen/teichoic acid export membrane protein
LNLLLIPYWHLVGAAVATTIAYAALAVANYSQSRAVVAIRLDGPVIGKALVAALAMIALVCSLGPVSARPLVDLSVRATAGAGMAVLSFGLLDGNARQWAWARLRGKSA